jgi:hypothetical protein
MDPDSGKQVFARLPELAHQIRDRLDSTSVRIHDDYVSSRPSAGLVRFAGYYVGYVVAQRLGQRLSLPELARLRDPQLRQTIDSVLHIIETEPPRTAGLDDPTRRRHETLRAPPHPLDARR